MTFNPNTEVALLKAQTKLRARKRHKSSKLDKYRTQLCKLYDEGATKAELQRWLAMRGIVVQWTTVKRWLDKNA
ncbi:MULTISPECIES: hypothetical protein [Pseudoalteromonas]|uniref:Transposase n=2 Tax=Pseudoalteromonas TaxID=53246 RepID=A0A1S1N7W6_9GAMM|nr:MULTISPECIES: hypothetical protein [Pseudoalteromonas]OHU86486.1 hypothetical protein BFC16_13280 [Pseudoalteromonas sp. JW3]OHU88989.1 hypothetical protein BET10_19480 [Pseudoalteromonas amylolytica]OHU94758.1 hypothetical protein BIW53_12030 [Pseudoalteromonas byunsanensis]